MFNVVRIEGCSGYRARLPDDQHGGEEKEAACLGSYPRLLWLYSRSMREDDEALVTLGDEVVARYLAGQKNTKRRSL